MGSTELVNRDVFSQILKVLAAAYPKFGGLDAEGMTAYYAILGDLPEDVLKAATMQYASEHKWFPTAAELRQTAFDIIDTAQGRIGAYEAWGEVKAQIPAVHYFGEPEFSDPLVYQAVDAMGGWRTICMSPEDMEAATRSRFIKAFEQLQQRDRTERRMLPQIRDVARRLNAGEKPQLGYEEGR